MGVKQVKKEMEIYLFWLYYSYFWTIKPYYLNTIPNFFSKELIKL